MFKTKQEALNEGAIAYNEYYYYFKKNKNMDMSFADYLDYWIDNYCNFNLKYATIVTYLNIIKVHLKPKLGMHKLSQLDSKLKQNFINQLYVNHKFSKCYLKGILKTTKEVDNLKLRNKNLESQIGKLKETIDYLQVIIETII